MAWNAIGSNKTLSHEISSIGQLEMLTSFKCKQKCINILQLCKQQKSGHPAT